MTLLSGKCNLKNVGINFSGKQEIKTILQMKKKIQTSCDFIKFDGRVLLWALHFNP